MFRKLLITASLLITTLYISDEACASLVEAQEVYEKAIVSSSLVKRIHEDGLERRQGESQQLKSILKSISEDHELDTEKLRALVISSLEQDKLTFEAVNQQLKNNKNQPGVKGATYQLLFNKMTIITEAALKLAKDGNAFFDILEGKLPKGYSIDAPVFNYIPESDHIYSHGIRGNALKSILMKTWLIQQNKSHLSDMCQLFDSSWLDTSPFVHITPLPSDFDASALQSSAHFFSDSKTPKALLTINNGYAFGGHREEPRYPQGKKYGPSDCSSFTALYSNCTKPFATLHQAHYFQEVNGFQFNYLGEKIVQSWEESKAIRQIDPYMQSIRDVLSPLQPSPDLQILKPGLVHAERNYKGISAKSEIALSGAGGHTGIFLGTIGSAADIKALTISANRDLEGSGKEFTYGVEPRTILNGEEILIMFFDIKNNG